MRIFAITAAFLVSASISFAQTPKADAIPAPVPAPTAAVATDAHLAPRETLDPTSADYSAEVKNREAVYASEAARGGFKWRLLTSADKKVIDFLLQRAPDLKYDLSQKVIRMDYAVDDVDGDGQPDILIAHWSINYCGKSGCSFDVYFGNIEKKPVLMTGNRMIPVLGGVKVDGVKHAL